MDFGQTLLAAQRNKEGGKSENAYYRTKFDPPKKENKPKDQLSDNIKKFLAKKADEEKQKALEEKRKRDELLAKRDQKAKNKISKMLKVTKSANKSVLEDAKNWNDTAITLEGTEMPDQDDYGYESQEAAAYYKKMMDMYSKLPDEEKFPSRKTTAPVNMERAKERVKHALQHADDPKPRQRKKRTNSKDERREPSPEPEPPKQEKPKHRRPAPPPLDFNELLKIAEQKKSEPIQVLVKKPVAEDTHRPMTKKEKMEYEQEMARKEAQARRLAEAGSRKNNGYKSDQNKPRQEDKTKDEKPAFTRIPKLSDRNGTPANKAPSSSSQSTNKSTEKAQPRPSLPKQPSKPEKSITATKTTEPNNRSVDKKEYPYKSDKDNYSNYMKSERDKFNEHMRKEKEKYLNHMKNEREKYMQRKEIESGKNMSKPPISKIDIRRPEHKPVQKESTTFKSKETLTKNNNNRISSNKDRYDNNRSDLQKQSNGDRKKVENNGVAKPKPVVGGFNFDQHISSLGKQGKSDMRSKYPPGDVRRRDEGRGSMKKPGTKRRAIESDSEYDSELDDFIDDGDEVVDYSSAIKEIFGYDRNKYKNIDDDVDCMESSFAQQMKEEQHSRKIGIMEDLEDMRKEREELERKNKAKKKRRIDD